MVNTVYDTTTGLPFQGTDADSAVASGTAAARKGSRVNVQGTDGQTVSVAAEDLSSALQQGFRLESPRQAAIREYVEDNKGLKGALKVGIGQLADEFLGGIPETAADLTQDSLEVEKRRALKEEFPVTNTVAGLTGFGAGLATGVGIPGLTAKVAAKAGNVVAKRIATQLAERAAGAVAERTAAGAAKQIASRLVEKALPAAAGAAVEGAVWAAPNAAVEAALGDPGRAAEEILMGAGVGALLGGGVTAAKVVGERVLESAAPKLKKLSENLFRNATGATGKEASRFTEDTARYLRDMELVRAFDTVDDVAPRIKATLEANRERLYKGLKSIDDKADLVMKDQVLAGIDDRIDELATNPGLSDQVRALRSLRDEVASGADAMTLSEAEAAKRAYQKRGKFDQAVPTPNREAAREVSEMYLKLVERNALAADEAVGRQFIEDKNMFRALKPAMDAAARRELVLNQSPLGGFLDMTSLYGGIAVGEPVTGVALGVARRAAAPRLASTLAVALDALSKGAETTTRLRPQIADVMASMTAKVLPKAVPASTAGIGALSRLLGVPETARRDEQLTAVATRLSELSANPQAQVAATDELTQGLVGFPAARTALGLKATDVIRYLAQEIPKPPGPQIFGRPWAPSDQQMATFNRKVRAVMEPASILEDLRTGTLTRDSVQAVKTVYPLYFRRLQADVMDRLAELREPVPYGAKVKLSLLLEIPLDQSLSPTALLDFQRSFQARQDADGGKSSQFKALDTQTDVQRLTSR